ncbi:MAG: cupredoxin domain-containing protein [Dehalococcoidia bacterium]|nr:cupredoxin domain-containing protein [Dehalococcoidia bacterium]
MIRRLALPGIAAALLGAAVIAAPGSAVAADRAVTIQNLQFGGPLAITAGDRVIWTNGDTAPHTATSDPGVAPAFDTGNIAPGATGSVTFATAGTFTYFCQVHPTMKGTITVAAAAANTPAAGTNTPVGGGTTASPAAPSAGSGLAEGSESAGNIAWYAAGAAAAALAVGGAAVALRRRA